MGSNRNREYVTILIFQSFLKTLHISLLVYLEQNPPVLGLISIRFGCKLIIFLKYLCFHLI